MEWGLVAVEGMNETREATENAKGTSCFMIE